MKLQAEVYLERPIDQPDVLIRVERFSDMENITMIVRTEFENPGSAPRIEITELTKEEALELRDALNFIISEDK